MRRRPLPSAAEAAEILGRKRSRPPRRPPPPAGRSLSKLLKGLEDRFGQGSGALHARWPEIIADKRLARFTEPVKLIKLRGDGGTILELKVDGPAAALIQHQAEDILARVNLVLGSGVATRLRIVQGPVKPRAETRQPPRRKRSAAPLDAAAEADLARTLEAAPDNALKTALLKLGRAVMRETEAKTPD
jgi:hypothetical protein